MKQTVLDVLMYLFEHYIGDEAELANDRAHLHAELCGAGFEDEQVERTVHPKILVVRDGRAEPDAFQDLIEQLRRAVHTGDERAAMELVRQLVPEYQGGEGRPSAPSVPSRPPSDNVVPLRAAR